MDVATAAAAVISGFSRASPASLVRAPALPATRRARLRRRNVLRGSPSVADAPRQQFHPSHRQISSGTCSSSNSSSSHHSERFAGMKCRAQTMTRESAMTDNATMLQTAPENCEDYEEFDVDPGEELRMMRYNQRMQQRMGGSMTYNHAAGMNYARVLPDLVVGSCPQWAGDIDHLAQNEDVRLVFCLQEDKDLEYVLIRKSLIPLYFRLDMGQVQHRAWQRGDVLHYRHPIKDFDANSLRHNLPQAVATLHALHQITGGTMYIHCTAGLGRAPGVALAYMNWLRGYTLKEANELLQQVRPCNPRYEAIRQATTDMLTMGLTKEATLVWSRCCHESVQIAGLDVGWNQRISAQKEPQDHRWVIKRELPVGRYEYKYIVDHHHWTFNPDAPTTPDRSGNINNVLEVVPEDEQHRHMLQRVMREDAVLAPEERMRIWQSVEKLLPNLPQHILDFKRPTKVRQRRKKMVAMM
eukprot:jgi/Chlat1/7350/Chrsp59S09142